MRRSCSVVTVLLCASLGCQESPPGDGDMDSLGTKSGEDTEGGDDEGSSSGDSGPDDTGSSSDTDGTEEGPIEGRPCPPDASVTADNFGMPFMLTWCAGCHSSELGEAERAGAPLDMDLDTLDATREHLLRIYARSADDNLTMPLAGGPSPEERALLGDWLACGAPE